jgi:hypothetical protein
VPRFFFAGSFFVGCSAKTSGTVSPADTKVVASSSKPDHRILVMLGSGFSTHPAILDDLVNKYGLTSSGGMVSSLLYPQSFTEGKKISLQLLSESADAPGTTIVVTVGAPEGTVRELNKIRRTHPDMQILTLFPAEQGLASEAVSSLLIDYTVSGDVLAAETGKTLSDADLGVLVLATVLSVEKPDPAVSPLLRLVTSVDSARFILKQKKPLVSWKITPFLDPETNIPSRNHVVLEVPAGQVQ